MLDIIDVCKIFDIFCMFGSDVLVDFMMGLFEFYYCDMKFDLVVYWLFEVMCLLIMLILLLFVCFGVVWFENDVKGCMFGVCEIDLYVEVFE